MTCVQRVELPCTQQKSNRRLVLIGRFRQGAPRLPAAGAVHVDRDNRTVSAVQSPRVNKATKSGTAVTDIATSGLDRTPNDAIIRTSQLMVCLAPYLLARLPYADLPRRTPLHSNVCNHQRIGAVLP